jgi:hypothetical protein
VLYPDPKQRIVLGWSIRWVAGLFALLMVAAGAIPIFAAAEVDSIRGDAQHAVFATADAERVCSVEITPATTELLTAKTISEAEGEKVEEEAHTAPALLSAHRLDRDLRASRATGFDDRPPRRIDPTGRLAPRAPPIA